MRPLNLFYEEPDPDRWVRFDRYPRRFIRRVVHGKTRPGGVMMIAINLMKGLDKIGYPYRFNDYHYIKRHPGEVACIIGKPQVLFDRKWNNPVVFGAGIYSHPIECPDLFEKYQQVKRFLVPGEWMRQMCSPYYGNKVLAWPVGIDTEQWTPHAGPKDLDFLIYDKIRWEKERMATELVKPLTAVLDKKKLKYQFIHYGHYSHPELLEKLRASKAVIFLCEHETQGSAYQQILATGTPILAWDRGGYWQDPAYYPERVKYQPVSSVPYWDDRCGLKFENISTFGRQLELFQSKLNDFSPRDYILENLTLEKCAEQYLKIIGDVEIKLG